MNRLTSYRRTLHQIPEIAFKEFKTHAFLVSTLHDIGFKTRTYLETDVIVYIDRQATKTIAFRSDIDGLPQEEKTHVAFKSKHDGRMHACGHDGHMSMLLEFAHYLKEHLDELTVNVLLIFQPAEEQIGGAKKLIDAGLFKDYPVDAIFGIHVYPNLNEGLITSKPGYFMAQANELTIQIKGKSSHGAMPELGIDANHIASLFLTTVYDRIQKLNETMRVICTFGKLHGGTVKNIISEFATLEGTMRTYTKSEYDSVQRILNETKDTLEKKYGCAIVVHIHDGYPPVNNDNQLFETFKKAIDLSIFEEMPEPLLIAEDFSFYQQEVPGVFFFIGTRNEDKGLIHGLHSSQFNLDEHALLTGVQAYKDILNHFMT